MKRKICFVTGSRAEYGILSPLMKEVRSDQNIVMQVIVTGMHLSPEFGLTYKEIIEDGLEIDEKVESILSSDTSVGVSKSMGLTIIGLSEAYARLSPDIIVVLGDRFEIFSAVSAALVCGIPVAHIAGGEVTEGSFDDSLRHAITKMSHLHFTSTEEYRRRVIQLGEDPRRVFNFGEIALAGLDKLKLLNRREVEQALNIKLNKINTIVTFHSPTLDAFSTRDQFQNVLNALDNLKDTKIIFTKSNADTEGRAINNMIDEYVLANPNKCIAFASLGRFRYLSLLQYSDVLIGNSSSGIVEAPFFKVPTINIGDRQKGRIRTESIIDCEPRQKIISSALNKALSKEFKEKIRDMSNPYYRHDCIRNIKKTMMNYNLSSILNKGFYDTN